MKRNEEQIIKGLEMFIDDMPVELHMGLSRTIGFRLLLQDTLSLINELTEEVKARKTQHEKFVADIEKQLVNLTVENEELKLFNKLFEQDIADRDEMLEKKVKEIYPEFMRDYKCMREELDGCYEDVKKMQERLKQAICDNTYPDFNREGKPINVWQAKTGYDLIDQIAKEMLEEI